jgi:hypothetical protein
MFEYILQKYGCKCIIIIATLERAFDTKGDSDLSTEAIKELILNLIKGIGDRDILIKIYTVVKTFSE